jgi:hypothetical protein
MGFYVRPEAGAGTVNQAGRIEAIRAELEAAGGNPYALAINHGGVTRAIGYDKSGGRVRLLGHEGPRSGAGGDRGAGGCFRGALLAAQSVFLLPRSS